MLKEKETVSDEFCWRLSNYIYAIFIMKLINTRAGLHETNQFGNFCESFGKYL